MHSTRLVWFVLPSLAMTASAQVNNTNKTVRPISLPETLELVLAHNLNLKVERISPDIAQYNVQVARAGGSSRVGIQRLGNPSGEGFTERNVSYDPTFFAMASKSYVSNPNYLTPDAARDLQNRANDTWATDHFTTEQLNQTQAQRDIARANADINNYTNKISSITDDYARLGKLSYNDYLVQTNAEGAKFMDAQDSLAKAVAITNASAARLQAAQAKDAQNGQQNQRASNLQNWLNQNNIGSTIPNGGLVDPATGEMIYKKEIDRTYNFATGFRGALPIGTVYEIRLDQELEKSTIFPDREYNSTASITVGQPFLRNFLIDAARANIQTSKKDLEIIQWGYQFAMMDYLTRAQYAYYDLMFARRNVVLQQEAVKLAETFLERATYMAQSGVLPPLEQKQAQAQAASARADLLVAQQQVDIKENALKVLISDDFVKWQNVRLEPTEELLAMPETYNLTESWSKALQQRPEYNQARLQLDKQNVMLKFARNQMLPSLDLIGSFQQNGLSYDSYGQSVRNVDGGNPSYFVGMIFTMALENRAARNNYKIAQADKQRSLLLMKQLEQTILMEVDNNVKIAQSDFSRIEATTQARLFAKQALDSYQSMFEAGKVTSFEVLQMQKNYTGAQFTEVNAIVAYNKALAQLYLSEGTTLDRNHIRVQGMK